MKNFIATTVIFFATATASLAETVRARITNVEPRYETVTEYRTATECYDVETPIYGTVGGNGASGGDVLAGMIIGGLLGKGITGNDDGAAAGAVMGGVIAADNGNQRQQVVTGYRTERKCSETSVPTQVSQIRDYLITFEYQGIRGTAYTYNHYKIGDTIRVKVSLIAH